MNSKAMPAAAKLLVGSHMPESFRGSCQTKKDIMVLQVDGLSVRLTTHPVKARCYEISHTEKPDGSEGMTIA
jgi:hypothetical protein